MDQNNMWEIEQQCFSEGYQIICGVDEAGRGPLAGPVCAAAVILPPNLEIPGLNDSKKLSDKKRRELFPIIKEKAVAYGIAYASHNVIDEINILQATYLAMDLAISQLSVRPDLALIDGNRVGEMPVEARTIVKGDANSMSIAAASILAKVARDRYITEMSHLYPEYNFQKHKGYGTKEHLELIAKHGPSPIHRLTFKGVREYVK